MRAPALAIAWELRRRHRLGLLALTGYLLLLGSLRLLVFGPAPPVQRGDARSALVIVPAVFGRGTLTVDHSHSLAAVVLVPLSAIFMYFLAVFSFGLEGDLAARPSIYPARMFALPVGTAALAGWPMLYGTLAMASLWLVMALLALPAWGIDAPLVWPALLAAVFLAWTQALTWMPYGMPGLRVIVAVLWLAALDAAVLLAINYEVPEPRLVAVLLPQLPLTYLAACFALARARRGDVPDWRGFFARRGRVTEALWRRRRPFPSPGRAQAWFEWRRHGLWLPKLVGILLPFELALLFVAHQDGPAIVFYALFGVLLLTPPFMAGFAAAAAGKSSAQGQDSHGMTAFTAARPLRSVALVGAQLEMALWSTLLTWLLVLVALLLALTGSGAWPAVTEQARLWAEAYGALRPAAIVLLGVLGLLALTFKQLVQNLYVALAGCAWAVKSSVFLNLSAVILLWPIAEGITGNGDVQTALRDGLPWIAGSLVGLKVSAGAWIATRLHGHRLLSDRALAAAALGWLLIVVLLYQLLAWLVTTPLIPRSILALAAVLAVPLVRLSAAPLALAWNRHR